MSIAALITPNEKLSSLAIPNAPKRFLSVHYVESPNDDEIQNGIVSALPFARSRVVTARNTGMKFLTHGNDVKQIIELNLSLINTDDVDANYEAGDTIGIIPENTYEEVQYIINHLNLTQANTLCKIASSNSKTSLRFVDQLTTIHEVLRTCVDLRAVPKKLMIRALADYTTDEREARRLLELCSREGSADYVKLILEGRVRANELLQNFPSCVPPVEVLLEHLPPLLPRPYSLISVPSSYPIVSIVFSLVQFDSHLSNGFVKEGLCTGYMKNTSQLDSDHIYKLYFRQNNGFKFHKNNEVPLVLVGPGTGIAPFIGYLREVYLKHLAKQDHPTDITLFYGCRYKDRDFLYKDELQKYLDLKLITLYVSYSREQTEKKARYVQDKMREMGEVVFNKLYKEHGVIYVCGDGQNMARAVTSALVDITVEYKGVNQEVAMACVSELRQSKRIIEDIWV